MKKVTKQTKNGVTLTTTDFSGVDIAEVMKKFRHDEILIGIPEEKGGRSSEGEISNAALLALNQFGSPLQNIPARPVLTIGIRNAQKEIAEQLKLATVNALKQGLSAIETYYTRAGIVAATAVKKAINDQEGIAPPSDATLAARKSAGFSGTKALVVTAQMRNAITYVLRGAG